MTKEYKSLGASDNSPDWFYPEWAATAPNSQPIVVRDTDSALGRYNQQTKEIGLKDIARIHGHMCDGLVLRICLAIGEILLTIICRDKWNLIPSRKRSISNRKKRKNTRISKEGE